MKTGKVKANARTCAEQGNKLVCFPIGLPPRGSTTPRSYWSTVWGAMDFPALLQRGGAQSASPRSGDASGSQTAAARGKMATCLYCGNCIAHLSVHGQRCHAGRCCKTNAGDGSFSEDSSPSPEPAVGSDWGFPLWPGDETGPAPDHHAHAAPMPAAITHPFPSDADWRLAQFISTHDGMPTGMLQELLDIFAMGGLTFQTTYQLFKHIDDLPGVSFAASTVFLDPIPGVALVPAHGPPVEYACFKRSLVEMLRAALTDEAATLMNPTLSADANPAPTHMTEAAEYQRQLRELRASTHLDDAVLLPLIFHSGMYTFLRYAVHATVLVEVLQRVPVEVQQHVPDCVPCVASFACDAMH